MKFFSKGKDGGPESKVTGYWLCEIKSLFSIVLLRFDHGTREAFHSHAFNAVSWVLRGFLVEKILNKKLPTISYDELNIYSRSIRPIITKRNTFHQVRSVGTTWVLSFRGPWSKTWEEYTEEDGEYSLTHGRQEVDIDKPSTM